MGRLLGKDPPIRRKPAAPHWPRWLQPVAQRAGTWPEFTNLEGTPKVSDVQRESLFPPSLPPSGLHFLLLDFQLREGGEPRKGGGRGRGGPEQDRPSPVTGQAPDTRLPRPEPPRRVKVTPSSSKHSSLVAHPD